MEFPKHICINIRQDKLGATGSTEKIMQKAILVFMDAGFT